MISHLFLNYIPLILSGLPNTMILAFGGFTIGLLLGSILAFLEMYTPKPLSTIALLVEEAIRGTPLLVVMFIVFFGLPAIGISLDPVSAAVVSIGIRSLAYQSQIIRGALSSIPAGQLEAALSIGMSRGQAFTSIVIPQAIRIAVPGLVNQFTIDLKDTSIAYAIGVAEVFTQAVHVAQVIFDYLTPLLFVGLIYFTLTFTVSRVSEYFYRRYSIPGLGGGV